MKGQYGEHTNLIDRIPAPFALKPIYSRKLRYIASQAVTNGAVTAKGLLNLVVWTNTQAIQDLVAYDVNTSVRISRVKVMFAPVSGLGTGTDEIVIDWNGGQAPDTRVPARGNSTVSAVIDMKPPKNSRSQWWISNDSQDLDDRLFTVAGPAGMVVDLTFSFVENQTIARAIAITGSTSNGISFVALDNATTAGIAGSQFLVPDSVNVVTVTTP